MQTQLSKLIKKFIWAQTAMAEHPTGLVKN